MKMSHVSSSRRAALDVITMQRRSTVYSQKMSMRLTKRSVHLLRQMAVVEQLQHTVINRASSFSPSTWACFHCKQSATFSKHGGTPFEFVTYKRMIHTAVSPSGSMSQILFSTRWGSFMSEDDARRQVAQLSAEEQGHLEKAIEEIKKRNEEKLEKEGEPPSWKQLKLLCYQNALPFIGFGFLDNVIMICVGEYIDTSIGVTLGISTMAAAGIGNMISDLAGLGLADQVEALCRKLGIPNPKLSSTQLRHRASRWMGLVGRCVGIIIGCTIGMAPLLWFDDPHKDHDSDSISTGGGEQH